MDEAKIDYFVINSTEKETHTCSRNFADRYIQTSFKIAKVVSKTNPKA